MDCGKAITRAELMTGELRGVLEEYGISMLELEPTEEVVHGRAMNFVTLKPNSILMPSGCPLTRKLYEKYGVETHEADVSEYKSAGGALGCLTGIVERSQGQL